MLSRRLGLRTLLLCGSLARFAAAEPTAAEDEYRRGVAAFEAGDYVVACRALGESYRLDPLPGALFTLATCEMRAGKLASAVAHFADYLELVEGLPDEQQTREVERRAVAEAERRKLRAQVPRLKLMLNDSSHTSQITLNGVDVPLQSLGLELPVDPGEQVVEQRFTSGQLHSERVTLQPGESKVVVLRASEDPPLASAAPQSPSAASDTAGSNSALPFVLGGIGVAGVVVGSIAGSFAIANAAVVRRECDGAACRSVTGKVAADAGQREALISTLAFGVGVAGLTAGIVLFATRSDAASPRTGRLEVGISPQQVTLSGAF
jgi:hypothetical protein